MGVNIESKNQRWWAKRDFYAEITNDFIENIRGICYVFIMNFQFDMSSVCNRKLTSSSVYFMSSEFVVIARSGKYIIICFSRFYMRISCWICNLSYLPALRALRVTSKFIWHPVPFSIRHSSFSALIQNTHRAICDVTDDWTRNFHCHYLRHTLQQNSFYLLPIQS